MKLPGSQVDRRRLSCILQQLSIDSSLRLDRDMNYMMFALARGRIVSRKADLAPDRPPKGSQDSLRARACREQLVQRPGHPGTWRSHVTAAIDASACISAV